MRYTGGLLGGSWLTALISDLGKGFRRRLAGAELREPQPGQHPLVQAIQPLCQDRYEAPRYLGFERWWGGHVILTGEEMQYIVDNLFVGNKLSSAEMVTADGVRLDFRKIRSPIVCLCSKGDNITPPQQALGWILDLYASDEDILAAGQTIVYTVHETIGHLGIFVSGSVAKRSTRSSPTTSTSSIACPRPLRSRHSRKKTPDAANVELVTGRVHLPVRAPHLDGHPRPGRQHPR
jgi:hypothetical protein